MTISEALRTFQKHGFACWSDDQVRWTITTPGHQPLTITTDTENMLDIADGVAQMPTWEEFCNDKATT